jgi:hypothetical protein
MAKRRRTDNTMAKRKKKIQKDKQRSTSLWQRDNQRA